MNERRNQIRLALKNACPGLKVTDDQSLILSKNETMYFETLIYKLTGKAMTVRRGDTINSLINKL